MKRKVMIPVLVIIAVGAGVAGGWASAQRAEGMERRRGPLGHGRVSLPHAGRGRWRNEDRLIANRDLADRFVTLADPRGRPGRIQGLSPMSRSRNPR